MKSITFENCIKDLKATGTLLLPAFPDRIDVQLDDYHDFLKLVTLWNVSVVFHCVQRLEETEINVQMINDDDLNRRLLKYVKEKFSMEAKKFNETLNRLRVHIGEEQEITLFFAHEGIVYCFEHSNNELYPENKEQFIQSLLEQYEDEITMLKEKETDEHLKLFRQRVEHLRSFLIEEKEFHNCTNVGARKAFVRNLDNDPNSPIDLSGIPSGIWHKTVEEAWEQIKLLKLRSKT